MIHITRFYILDFNMETVGEKGLWGIYKLDMRENLRRNGAKDGKRKDVGKVYQRVDGRDARRHGCGISDRFFLYGKAGIFGK